MSVGWARQEGRVLGCKWPSWFHRDGATLSGSGDLTGRKGTGSCLVSGGCQDGCRGSGIRVPVGVVGMGTVLEEMSFGCCIEGKRAGSMRL